MTVTSTALDIRFEAAKALAREAGFLARRRFVDRDSFTVGFKGPQDYLTEVDGEVERLLAAKLAHLFPEDGFVGEEGAGRSAAPGAVVWVVDPIDGTANFAKGIPHFCNAIAAVVGREVVLGVIYDPMVDELFAARKGGGATLNGQPLKVSDATSLSRATLEIGWNARDGAAKYLGLLGRVVASGASPVRCGSGALGLAYIAAGRRDGYAEHFMYPWDCLAATVMILEAGGYCSEFLQSDDLRKGNGILACAPGIKDEFRKTVAIDSL